MPVLITNMRDVAEDQPNQTLNYESSRMTRRFFVYDTISGITETGGYFTGATPKYVRFAESVTLTV